MSFEPEWYFILKNGELKQIDKPNAEFCDLYFVLFGYTTDKIDKIEIFYQNGEIIYNKTVRSRYTVHSRDFAEKGGEEIIKKLLLKAEQQLIHKYEYGYYL